jgi:hypothetical protein
MKLPEEIGSKKIILCKEEPFFVSQREKVSGQADYVLGCE